MNIPAPELHLQSPRQKGALVELSQRLVGSVPHIIVFQYNPESLTRTLSPWQPRRPEAEEYESEEESATQPSTAQPVDPPETFTLNLELDAADAIEEFRREQISLISGVADRIAALEMLLYPADEGLFKRGLRSAESGGIAQAAEAPAGVGDTGIEGPFGGDEGSDILPRGSVPIVLFVWGPGRILPVRLTSFRVEEQAYSPALYPIRAEVSLGLKVLTPADLESHWDTMNKELAVKAYEFTKKQKQVMAMANQANNVESMLGMLPF